MTFTADVTDAPLDPARAHALVAAPTNGAVLVFSGLVRDHHEGRSVVAVEYQAYREMAVKQLLAVIDEVAPAHGVTDVAVFHRTGLLAVGETSLIVAVGSPHRAAAFHAGLALIDLLKKRVPVWKREVSPDGSRWQDGELPAPPL